MIIEFSVKNFRSIYNLETISFAASKLTSSKENSAVDKSNIFTEAGKDLLKVVGIYGANASGKTNIIKALEYFCDAIGALPSPKSRLSKLTQPFLYQNDTDDKDSFFQIVTIVNGKKYRYGFTVRSNKKFVSDDTSADVITSEWLFGPKNKNHGKYFTREGLEIDKSNLIGEGGIAPLEYEHALFLTHVASYSKGICALIRNKISGFTTTKFSLRSDYYRFHSIRQIEDDDSKNRFLSFLSSFGLEYEDIFYNNESEFKKKNNYPLDNLFLVKNNCYDDSNPVTLNMNLNESDGTKRLFDLAGLFIHAFNLDHGGLIILDEIDSNFHPALLIKLIRLFNDADINKANTQLLFTSHDTNLMRPDLMRRDQFYFSEKNMNESTRFYSLAELKGIRNDANFAKQYLAGFYGSLPVLSQFVNESNISDNGTLAN